MTDTLAELLEDMTSDEMIEGFNTECKKCKARQGCINYALSLRDEHRVESLRNPDRTGEECSDRICF